MSTVQGRDKTEDAKVESGSGGYVSVKRQLERTRRQLLSVKRDAETLLAPGVLEEIFYRGSYVVADGFPTGTGGVGRGTTQTATERAALRLASPSEEEAAERGLEVRPDTWEEREPDPVADALRELTTNADAAQTYMHDARQCRDFVISVEARIRGKQSSANTCSLCDVVVTGVGEDRLRSLYCPACFSAWRRAGYPHEHAERRKFEGERQKFLAKKQAC